MRSFTALWLGRLEWWLSWLEWWLGRLEWWLSWLEWWLGRLEWWLSWLEWWLSWLEWWFSWLEWWLSRLESYEYMLLVRDFVELMESVRGTSHCVELSVTLGGNGLITQPP